MEFSWDIVIISLFGGLATALGALIVILIQNISTKSLSLILGFAAGVMIAISTFNLIPEALAYGSLLYTAGGFMAGALFMLGVDTVLTKRQQTKGGLNNVKSFYQMGIFIAAGIALHNLPEGLALGAGFQVADKLGFMLAGAIALHNIPEGIGIAAPLKMAGVKSFNIFLITASAGLFTLVGTLISFLILGISANMVSSAMGFAAGAMIYIASDELIPQSHKQHSHTANIGILLGFLLVFCISNL